MSRGSRTQKGDVRKKEIRKKERGREQLAVTGGERGVEGGEAEEGKDFCGSRSKLGEEEREINLLCS